MDEFFLELLLEKGVKTVLVKGTDTEDYGHVVPVEFPEVNITTKAGRDQVVLNCSTIDVVTEVIVNGTDRHTVESLCQLLVNRRRR